MPHDMPRLCAVPQEVQPASGETYPDTEDSPMDNVTVYILVMFVDVAIFTSAWKKTKTAKASECSSLNRVAAHQYKVA